MRRTIKKSRKDKRHTSKPYTWEMWNKYFELYKKHDNEYLAYHYGVSKKTIYAWNSELYKMLVPDLKTNKWIIPKWENVSVSIG